MIEIIQAIFLGVVEGLTEFLPISSTGHLIVAEDLVGYKDTAEIFTVVIQMGAIAAVLWFYRADLIQKTAGIFAWEEKSIKFWTNLGVASLPALITGYLLKDHIDKYAVSLTVAIALILGGIAIWLIEIYHKAPKSTVEAKLDRLTVSQAFRVGLFQILALIPGVSRSGATIMGGLLSGLDRVTATAFSFYLSIPVILLASAYQLINGRDNFDSITGGGLSLVVGTIAAFITALVTIKWLLHYVARNDFKIFAYYRIILGVVILIALI